MENELLLNFGSNMASMAIAMTIFVVYKRCLACKSHVHCMGIDCESDAIKLTQRKNLIKQAMAEFRRDSIRKDANQIPQHIGDERSEHSRSDRQSPRQERNEV